MASYPVSSVSVAFSFSSFVDAAELQFMIAYFTNV